jgi:hypothetical protein
MVVVGQAPQSYRGPTIPFATAHSSTVNGKQTLAAGSIEAALSPEIPPNLRKVDNLIDFSYEHLPGQASQVWLAVDSSERE